MNKKVVNNWIEKAVDAIKETGIAKNGTIDGNFRAQISSFGAAIVMGSLKAAVAFYSEGGRSQADRVKILQAIYYIIHNTPYDPNIKGLDVFNYVCQNDNAQTKEAFINASIALKLATNFFDQGKGNDKNKDKNEDKNSNNESGEQSEES